MVSRWRIPTVLICLALAATACAQPRTTPRAASPRAVATPAAASATPAVHAPQAPAPAPASVIGSIDGRLLTELDLDQVLQGRFGRQVAQALVRSRVIEGEAKAKGIVVSSADVSARVAAERLQYPSDQAYLDHVTDLGFTPTGYRQHLRTELLLDKLLETSAPVSDAEVKAYYEAHKADFAGEPELHLLAFDVPRADAVPAYRALIDGTPFASVANRFGNQPLLAPNADLGWVSRTSIPVKGLWETADGMPKGETSAPVEAEGKFYLMRVLDKRSPEARGLAQARAAIEGKLREGKGPNREQYVEDLITRADVKLRAPWLASLDQDYRAMKGIRVQIDGHFVRLAQAPYVSATGTLMVPVKRLIEQFGGTARLAADKASAQVRCGEETVEIRLSPQGSATADADGEMRSGVLFVPARKVLTALGVKVNWNPTRRVLTLSAADA